MKFLICLVICLLSLSVKAQVYKYYFLEVHVTGKMEVQLYPESDIEYPDIDNLIVSKRDTTKNGAIKLSIKKFKNYSSAFNALSSAGLEFVQFSNLNKVGGATELLAGSFIIPYAIWRKKISD